MLATYVEPKKTPLSIPELDRILSNGLATILGKQPSLQVRSVMLAKVRLESGNGQHNYNWDVGNVKRGEKDAGNYTCIELNEVIDNKLLWFAPQGRIAHRGGPVIAESSTVPPGHYQTRMAALAGPTDGGYFYVDFIAKKTRYAKAFQALLAGNPEAYSRELSAAGYYTAPVEQYTATVMKLYTESLARLSKQPFEEIVQPDKREWHNQLVLDKFTDAEYERVRNLPGFGGGRAILDFEEAEEAERAKTDPAPPPEVES